MALGKLRLPLDGSPWELPCPNWIRTGRSLSELGWYGKVGPVVPHRWTDRITNRVGKRSLPLVWAAAIRPKGKVDYTHMRQCVAGARVVVNPELPYVIRRPCILIQRTANSKQTRRINAAVVDRRSLSKIGPFLAENHVIALFPPAGLSNDKNLRQMAKTLNSEECTRLYNRVSGSTSISLKILMSMRLPVVKIPTR